MDAQTVGAGKVLQSQWTGLYCNTDEAGFREWEREQLRMRTFIRCVCPCGIESVLPVGGIPWRNIPHPCGNLDHWTFKRIGATKRHDRESAD